MCTLDFRLDKNCNPQNCVQTLLVNCLSYDLGAENEAFPNVSFLRVLLCDGVKISLLL